MSYIFIALAALCNAVMDILRFRYSESIFKHWDWFNPLTSLNLYWFWGSPVTQLNDGWHFTKMLMITFILLAVIKNNYQKRNFIKNALYFVSLGVTWIITFNIFYVWLLRL